METALTKFEGLTPDKIELIKNTVAKGATDNELALFLTVAKRAGLDPFTKQIHFVKRGDVGTIQTGIDGYRSIAEQTGTLAGIDDAVFDSEENQFPKKASVTVYRMVNSKRVPFTASARWSEYAPMYNGQLGTMWRKMPYLMLGKCAEALALRKAFPNDLSGLYTNEEMQQAAGYDTSPVEDDAKVIIAGTDTSEMKFAELEDAAADEDQIPEGVIDQKKVIMSFVKMLEPKTDMRSGKAIAQVVADITQTALTPKNYKFIIGCLREEIAMRESHHD